MSKAILIINVPDDFEYKKSSANITLFDGKHRMWNRIAYVKPLPQKMNAREKDNMIISIGWNLCLDEIFNENNVYEIEIKDSKYQKQIDEVFMKDMVDKFFKGEE